MAIPPPRHGKKDFGKRPRRGRLAAVTRRCVWGLFATLAAGSAEGQLDKRPASTVQLPTFGVAVDADGLLAARHFPDPDGRLRAARIQAARGQLPPDVGRASEFRCVSLVRLERQLRADLAAGRGVDDVAQHLAGLTRVEYVLYLPASRDLVLAGPAEGWVDDLAGRAVGWQSGRPTVLLVDLAAAIRVFPPGVAGRPFIGCTIDPDPQGLVRLQAFQRTIPSVIAASQQAAVAAAMDRGIRDSLGDAAIRTFGVSSRTHFAQVLVEADFRMKQIGIGLEPPPVPMATFVGSLRQAPGSLLQRWWFEPDPAGLEIAADGRALHLGAQTVRLSAEDRHIGPRGEVTPAPGPLGKSARLYATAFTQKYPEISQACPVYAQLRNMIDLSIAAAFLCRNGLYDQAGWTPGALGDERLLPIETHPPMQRVTCPANVVSKGRRLLALAGGGVEFLPDDELEQAAVWPTEQADLAARRIQAAPAEPWWWDPQ